METTKRLMTIEEAADRLSLAVSTLYAWMYQGRIGYVKLGRTVRFREEDIEECIQRGVVNAKVA